MKRFVLLAPLAATALSLLATAPCRGQSDAARAFFRSHLIVDGTCFPDFRAGSALQRFKRNEDGKIDMGEFRTASGTHVAVWDIRRREDMLKMIRGLEIGDFVNARVIRTVADLEAVYRGGDLGWLFYTQNPWPLEGGTAPIADWHRDGLRMLQIVYGSTLIVPELDKLGTGSSREDDETSGLTDLGRAVVAECERVGIVVDVSHCNRQTTLDIATVAKAPVTCTHAGCDAVTPNKRNKTDEEIRAIARTGGLFGITPVKFMLSAAPAGATMDDFIRHLEYAIGIAGIDHVGIASDISRNGVPEDEIPAYTCPELNGEARWLHVFDAMKSKGYSDNDLAKLFGLNYLRVFRTVFKP